jgi:hypothetical protein
MPYRFNVVITTARGNELPFLQVAYADAVTLVQNAAKAGWTYVIEQCKVIEIDAETLFEANWH